MTARRSGLSLALFALVLSACLDLTKEPPAPLFIDDFETGRLMPEWSRFEPWSCGTDGGPGGVDGGQSVTCAIGIGGVSSSPSLSSSPSVPSMYELRAHFVLQDPLDGGSQPIADVVTRTPDGSTVDLTVFTTLSFSAFLEDDPLPASPLPTGTELQVGLGCTAIRNHPLAFRIINSTIGVMYPDAVNGPFNTLLSEGTTAEMVLTYPSQAQAQLQTCLRQIDSIHFTIKPEDLPPQGSTLGPPRGGSGTLHLDNIYLQ
jgi:hypothetical protein